jgi:hypothetical protein
MKRTNLRMALATALCCGALLVVGLLAGCGNIDGDVLARDLDTGELKSFPTPGDVPPNYYPCPDPTCTLPPSMPCEKLGTKACELHPGCRLKVLWCSGTTPPPQPTDPAQPLPTDGAGTSPGSPIDPNCNYSCIPKKPLLCEELADKNQCAVRPDCEWGPQVCPMIACADGDPNCVPCPPEACQKKAPPQCGDVKGEKACGARSDCEWMVPACMAPGHCDPFCGPKQISCPPIAPPPPHFCKGGTVTPRYDAQGCVVGFDCKQINCPPIAPPPPDYCKGGTIEYTHDAQGCMVGYSCKPQQCPPIAPPPPDFCKDGTIEWKVDANGCTVGFKCVKTQSCQDLAALYAKTVEQARECNPFILTAVKQCMAQVQDGLYCGCPTIVNTFAAAELKKLKDLEAKFVAAGCDKLPVACPAVVCQAPTTASCQYDTQAQKGFCMPDSAPPPPTPFP